MILKGISQVTAYRMHVPKWAVAPTLEDGVPYIRVADFPGNKLNTSGIK
ncbi:hypothetical protein SAMN02787142_2535 [Burkholderia sp. WP9]|nr:hypothetical protein SAMN02787142_2535 [Burkholderia sp. WP9]